MATEGCPIAAGQAPAYRRRMPQLRRIGLGIDAVASYGRGIIRGVMSFCRANPHWVITIEPLWSFGALPRVEEWDVDGMIVQTYSREFEDEVLRRGVPTMSVSNFCNHVHRLPTVVPDDAAVARMGADYLLSLGFRDLAFCWPGNSQYGRLRLQAFRERAAAAGVRLRECDVSQQDLSQWLMDLPKPVGMLGCNDDWAHRVLNVARRLGIKVPDEIAVLGVDDDELFNTLVTPSLSSIAIPAEQIGYTAARELDRLMDGHPPPAQDLMLPPVRVVVRESTDVLSMEDEDVVLAIRFIREQSTRPLQVSDVLAHVPISRRSLERRFREMVGHSISSEIRRAHIERAKQLLLTTDMLMPEVATASGFTTATRLGIVFQKETGESPTQFRRRGRLGPQGSMNA
jgi:LacI family transcriptional regulator, galactose operon repressor